jgi:hypothetical protein
MDNDPFNPHHVDQDASFFQDPKVDPTKNYLEELVGEGKKFKSVDDLARGKAESDAYINSLIREIREVKEELNKRMTVEDLLQTIKQESQGQTTSMSNDQRYLTTGTHDGNANGGTGTNSLDLESIKKALKDELTQEQEAARRRQNYETAVGKLTELHGDQASAFLASKAKELDVSMQYLKNLAEEKPSLLFKLVGVGETSAPSRRSDVFSAPQSRVNTTGIQAKSYGEHKPMSYYQQMKAKDPKAYFSPKTSVEMHKAALALGDSFFDT